MAGPETYSVQTRQQGAAPQLPSLSPIKSAGPTTRPATTAQPGSISYVGAQVAEETAASQYNRGQDDATAQWLLKAASAVIEPHMKELQFQQVTKGIQEATAGKSIDEIKDAPPAYSFIFGDSDLVTSARAYQAQIKVDKYVTQAMRNIETEMADYTPEQARNRLTKDWLDMQSGDTLTDAVANQHFLNAMPGLFQQYQKQNYKNWQMNAKASQQQAFSAQSASLNQKMMSANMTGTISNDDVLKSQAEFLAGLAPVKGQTLESWGSNVITTIQDAANNGNFHSVKVMLRSGMLDKLPPDQQNQVISYVRGQEQKSINDVRITPKYASQIADLQIKLRTGGRSPKDVLEETSVLNAQAAAEFGYTAPLIGPDEVAGWMGMSTNLVANEINQARTDAIQADKHLAQKNADTKALLEANERELQLGSTRFSSGGQLPQGESTEPTKKAGVAAYDRMESINPGSGVTSMVNLYGSNHGLVIPGLQARFQAPFQTADKTEWTPEFDATATKTFMEVMTRPGGDNAAVAYFGPDNYKKMNNYLSAMNNGLPQPLAYHEAFVQPRRLGKTDTLTKQDHTSLESELSPAWYSSFYKDNMSQSAQQTVLQAAAGHLADLKANSRYTDDDSRVKDAINLALHDGNIAVYGKWAWDRDKSAKPMHEQASLSSDQLYGIVSGVMDEMPQFRGKDYDRASFIERTDPDGHSDLMVYMPDGAGNYSVGIVTLNSIKDHARKIREQQRAEESHLQTQLNQGVMGSGGGTGQGRMLNNNSGTGLFKGGTGQ